MCVLHLSTKHAMIVKNRENYNYFLIDLIGYCNTSLNASSLYTLISKLNT